MPIPAANRRRWRIPTTVVATAAARSTAVAP